MLSIDKDALRPLVEEVVTQTVELVGSQRDLLGDQLVFTEPEAAALLRVKPHVLRDCRRRGQIEGFPIGNKIHYNRAEILRFCRLLPDAKGKGGAR